MNCTQCHSGNTERASVVVARETTQSTGTGGTVVNGEYVTFRQNVTSQTNRAQELTADEPKRKGCCLGTFLLLLITTIGVFYLVILEAVDVQVGSPDVQQAQPENWFLNGPGIQQALRENWFLEGILAYIAIIVVFVVVSRLRKISFKSRYQSWLNQYYRRYYCNNCGAIFQNY